MRLTMQQRALRAAEILRRRRESFGYPKRAAFARDTGVAYKNVSRVESGKPRGYDSTTLQALDAAYGYNAGSIEDVFAGGDPRPLEGDVTERTEDAPALSSELLGRIVGTPPCMPNESLEWHQDPIDEANWVYTMTIVFVEEDRHAGRAADMEKISMPLSKNRTTENVAKVLREAITHVRFNLDK
ncbi:hypothetical protein BJF83_22385 [Nocardiopsis sp. CNR-923]|nr:hypothetical protein BJF83_22385 [Nocardiopsis sp. CNR-923]